MSFGFKSVWVGVALVVLSGSGFAEELTLTAEKDSFARGNDRNRNSGANAYLLIMQVPHVRSFVSFDLAGITNKIESVEFRFRMHNDVESSIGFVVAPMVSTPNNAAWGEGKGAYGNKGLYAQPGDSCYVYSAFDTVPWESESGAPLVNMAESSLWKTSIPVNNVEWEEGEWVSVKLTDLKMLEELCESESPMLTLGLWGTSGNGYYHISSKESGYAPELILTLKTAVK